MSSSDEERIETTAVARTEKVGAIFAMQDGRPADARSISTSADVEYDAIAQTRGTDDW